MITEEAETEIRRLRREYPRLNAVQIHDHLVEEAILPATVSLSSVQRYINYCIQNHNSLLWSLDS